MYNERYQPKVNTSGLVSDSYNNQSYESKYVPNSQNFSNG
jgi:hypothetical protein